MVRTRLVLAVVAALLGLCAVAHAANPRTNPKVNLRTVELAGTVAVDGTPSAQSPVRFTARLIADTRGVPLQRGGRAVITMGRLYVNTIGTVISGCLAESSLGLAGTYSAGTREAAEARGDILRVGPRGRVAIDVDVLVDAALRGAVGPDCSTVPRRESATLALRGRLGSGVLGPVQMSATAPVTLVDGRRVTMRVSATAAIRRYLPPA